MLEVKNLSYQYPKSKEDSLQDLSLSFESGKLNILLGKNGSGKSTLRKAILGFIKPKSGEVILDQENLLKRSSKEKAKRIGYLPQDIPSSSLSVYDTLLLGRLPYQSIGVKKTDTEIVYAVAEKLNLVPFLLKRNDELSLGERQIVRIGKSFVQETKTLILDEPTSSLDIENQVRILSLRKKEAKENGLTILISLHDINLALKFGDVFHILKEGKALYSGDIQDLTQEILRDAFHLPRTLHKEKERTYITY